MQHSGSKGCGNANAKAPMDHSNRHEKLLILCHWCRGMDTTLHDNGDCSDPFEGVFILFLSTAAAKKTGVSLLFFTGSSSRKVKTRKQGKIVDYFLIMNCVQLLQHY